MLIPVLLRNEIVIAVAQPPAATSPLPQFYIPPRVTGFITIHRLCSIQYDNALFYSLIPYSCWTI